MSRIKPETWRPCEWPYDPDTAKRLAGKCWVVDVVNGGHIYLTDVEYFYFTASFGHNSDRSYSGCFYGHPDIKTLDDAKAALSRKEF